MKQSIIIVVILLIVAALFFGTGQYDEAQPREGDTTTTGLEQNADDGLEQGPAEVVPPSTGRGEQELITIEQVIDGDTIHVHMGGTSSVPVRLIGVDAPETAGPYTERECYGEASAEYLRDLLLGSEVWLETDSSQDRFDVYGRLLAYVYRDDALLVNLDLIESGAAREYTFKGRAYQFQDLFQEAEADARAAKRGLWADGACDL
jgi:micrococcal nuclease